MAERLITINIRRYLVGQPRTKRFKKAARYIRSRVAHYAKVSEENVKISKELNNRIIKHYSKKMVPVKLNVKLDGGKAVVNEFVEKKAEKETQKPAVKKAQQPQQATKAASKNGVAAEKGAKKDTGS
ncbi:MAG: hypothetical protein QXN59_02015 [Candidatus Micrarchaeaceae archaeon]